MSKTADAGAPEITDKMLEAGEAVAREIDPDIWDMMIHSRNPEGLREKIAMIFSAMTKAQTDN